MCRRVAGCTRRVGPRRARRAASDRGRCCESCDNRRDSSLEVVDMKRNVVIHRAMAICMCSASSADAHHSHPLFYDQCKKVTIEGRVESAQWKNPHVLIVLKMDDGTHIYRRVGLAAGTDKQRRRRLRASRADGGSARRCHRKSITRSGSDTRQLPDHKRDLEHANR